MMTDSRRVRMRPLRAILWLCLAFLMVSMAYGTAFVPPDEGVTPPQALCIVGPILPVAWSDGQCLAPDYLKISSHRNDRPIWCSTEMEVPAPAPSPDARSGTLQIPIRS